MAAPAPIQSLLATGTKLWLDSIDPDLVEKNRQWGATGATSNPIIVADLIRTGRFDDQLESLLADSSDDSEVAWKLTDQIVCSAQEAFAPVWSETQGNDGYVSFELDPLLEDAEEGPSHQQRVESYVQLGKDWSQGHTNRMIKVPATPAGLEAVEELAASGVTLNVTLIFTQRQYELARDAIWRGVQRCDTCERFKSVYSIFVSRVDVYTDKHVADLSDAAQGMVGIVNAKQIWQLNQDFWADKNVPLQQEMIFASTGTKKPEDPKWKYVAAFAGSDIQTNPPATNDAVAESGYDFTRQVDQLPPAEVLAEIAEKVDYSHLEKTLMEEGLAKFASPQKELLALVAEKRAALTA
ncbi:MAG: transaldolase [bacterium]|nr:transaldolase [bacterium]